MHQSLFYKTHSLILISVLIAGCGGSSGGGGDGTPPVVFVPTADVRSPSVGLPCLYLFLDLTELVRNKVT